MLGLGTIIAADEGTLGGSALASWTPVTVLICAYVAADIALFAYGSSGDGDWNPLGALQRIGRGLTRLTGIPGWAAIAIGQSLFSLLLAGVGFYSDVQWHIALGRDDELFTAPHTAILLGLIGILAASVFGILVATLDRWDGGRKVLGFTVPWSMVPLGALGVGAVSGFPMDEIWHSAYGVDVTMWSPTHMLMILGASFTGIAAWLVMAETGVKPRDNRWASFLHGFAAWLTLQGLVASQGEFSFGVPQFSQVFQPMLISMAAALAFVAIRLVLGPGRAVLLGAIFFITQFAQIGGDGPVETRHGATFLLSAIVVESAARMVGVDRRSRFAVVSGVGVATIGLAGEWLWNSDGLTAGAPQAWNSSLIAPAVVTSLIAGVGCAVLGTAFARAFRFAEPGRQVGTLGLVVAAILAIGPVLAFLPRHTADVTASITLEPAASDDFEEAGAIVTVELTPADAADDAHWFQATAWQGGGLVLADMVEQSPGVWVSESPVPTEGLWKTLVRLHRNGNQLMAAPIWFPDDPFIGEPEIPAVDRTIAMGSESQYLLRETNEGNGWLSPVVHTYLALTVLAWLAAFAIGVRRIGGGDVAVERSEPKVPTPQAV
ncbi:hypothetical protein [Actinospongicola halichondriae]|uniref:hypothetical protein n=1 Tax=Actinospongicola halichondriae TaxID=3236844 RepID=UPI003D585258